MTPHMTKLLEEYREASADEGEWNSPRAVARYKKAELELFTEIERLESKISELDPNSGI